MSATAPPRDLLVQLLRPVLARIAELQPARVADPDSAARVRATLEAELPFEGEHVQSIGEAVRRGVADGWLCDRGDPGARFSRVAKPSPDTFDLSIDVVELEGAGMRHGHPGGEITLGFPTADPEASRFDGHPPGWVVMPAGSTHTPTVTGPAMHLLYVLPGGRVDWNPDA